MTTGTGFYSIEDFLKESEGDRRLTYSQNWMHWGGPYGWFVMTRERGRHTFTILYQGDDLAEALKALKGGSDDN